MTEKRFKKSVSGTLATGIILEKELSTDEVFNELIKLEKENKKLKDKLENGICPLCGARVSKCGGLQKYKGDFE